MPSNLEIIFISLLIGTIVFTYRYSKAPTPWESRVAIWEFVKTNLIVLGMIVLVSLLVTSF